MSKWIVGLATVAVAAISVNVFAHSDPSGAFPPVPAIVFTEEIYPPRWSWLHWWEANRDPYLYITRQNRWAQEAQLVRFEKNRKLAVDSLVQALQSEVWQLRAAACIALGKMGETQVFDQLKQIAIKDQPEVRLAAIKALAFLDTEQTESTLINMKYDVPLHRQAGLAGLGILTTNKPETIARLQQVLNSPDPAMPTIAAWALKRRNDPNTVQFLNNVLNTTQNPWLATEALLALGHQGDPQSIAPLRDILLATDQGKQLPAWQYIEIWGKERTNAINDVLAWRMDIGRRTVAYDNYLKMHAQWQRLSPNNDPPLTLEQIYKSNLELGIEKIYLSRLRATAAIALGSFDTQAARDALAEAINLPDDKYSDLYKGFAIMSLGSVGDEKSLALLSDILYGRDNRKSIKDKEVFESPLRGYAAVAIGLYARPQITIQGLRDRPDFTTAANILGDKLQDNRESLEVRAACAVGLGLTSRNENLRLLQTRKIPSTVKDDLLIGYLILGRGLLGDRNIIEPADRYLTLANERKDMAGILGRRAAVLGLGLLGRDEVLPILIRSWDLEYYVNHEVIFAFALAEAYSATQPLIDLMQKEKSPYAKAYGARSLGELFARTRPGPLTLFLNDSNYTMRNQVMIPFQTDANEFLYSYLILAFGEQWR